MCDALASVVHVLCTSCFTLRSVTALHTVSQPARGPVRILCY